MRLSRDKVNVLARAVSDVLKAMDEVEFIEAPNTIRQETRKLLEELTLEDRINDEVRVILEAYSEEMNKTGANYQEMFRKVKSELVRKYKAVL